MAPPPDLYFTSALEGSLSLLFHHCPNPPKTHPAQKLPRELPDSGEQHSCRSSRAALKGPGREFPWQHGPWLQEDLEPGRERQQAPETLDSLPEFSSQPRDSPHLPLFRPFQSLSGTSATTPNHPLSQLDYTSHTASESLSSQNLVLRVLFSEALRITKKYKFNF